MAESNNDKKLFDVWLSLKCGYKTNVFDKLRIHFANAEDVYNADADSLSSPGINPKQLNALKDKRISKAQEIVKYCNKLGIKIISFGDSIESAHNLNDGFSFGFLDFDSHSSNLL